MGHVTRGPADLPGFRPASEMLRVTRDRAMRQAEAAGQAIREIEPTIATVLAKEAGAHTGAALRLVRRQRALLAELCVCVLDELEEGVP